MAYRRHICKHIRDLDNDSLLQIFNFYRLEDKDKWYLRLSWRKLTHICRRWRYLIFDSSSHLDIYLLLTNGFPSISELSQLPPLPLVIDYSDRPTTFASVDEENVRLGLKLNGRVHRVALCASSSSLRMWLELMNKPFPRLRDLSLLSTTPEEISLVLPETLQVPFLLCLSLHGISLPRLSLLSSMISLSTLSLTHIRESCYFPPSHLVAQLQGLFLEELSIGFAIPIPLPSSEGELLPAPIIHVTLPTLRRLTFRGVGIYLDNLIAQINTPLLERLSFTLFFVSFTLFFELTFTLVNLTKFIRRTKGIGCLVTQIIFNKHGASIDTGYHEQQGIRKSSLQVSINCESLEWQIDSATQVCSALRMVLSDVEELTLDLGADVMPLYWDNALGLDSVLWLELLLPFTGVKKLHIGRSLIFELSQALESIAGGLALDFLPGLQCLEVQPWMDDAKNVFSTFVKIRESMGRPVHLLFPRYLYPITTWQRSRVDSVDWPYTPYRNQAIDLISICRAFIQAQEQTLRSYNELKR